MLTSLYIDQYKNLRDFSLGFDDHSFIDRSFGKNRTGKSNLCKAFIEIFRPMFKFINRNGWRVRFARRVFDPMALNKNQQRVYDWLNGDLNLPVFAEAYKGAATLINRRSAGYVSFVAHAGRDLMNRLAPTVAGIKSERVQYQQHIDKLQNHWRDEWRLSNELLSDMVEKGHLIPIDVCQKISTIIDDHKSGRMRSSEADGLFFSTFLDYSDRKKIPRNFLSEWKAAKDWFLGHAHLRDKPFCAETNNDLVKHFNCLDGYLYIAASSQYDRIKELNEILEATNQ